MLLNILGFSIPFLVTFILEIVTRFFWIPRWKNRKIEGLSLSLLATGIRIAIPSILGLTVFLLLNNIFLAVSSASSLWLIIVVLYTDVISMKIPKEPCWAVFLINLSMVLAYSSIPVIASAIVAFLLVGFVLIVTALISRGGLGSGDLRLMLALSLLGGWFGYTFIMFGLIIGSVMQIPVRIILKKRNPDRDKFPFAPSLVAGFLIGLIFLGNISMPYNEWSGVFLA